MANFKSPSKKTEKTPSQGEGENYVVAKAVGAIMGVDADNVEKLSANQNMLNVSVNNFLGLNDKTDGVKTFFSNITKINDNVVKITSAANLIASMPKFTKDGGGPEVEEATVKGDNDGALVTLLNDISLSLEPLNHNITKLIKHLPQTDGYYVAIEGMHKILEKTAGEKSVEEKTIKVTVEGGEALEKLQTTLDKLVEETSKEKGTDLTPLIVKFDELKDLFEKHIDETAKTIIASKNNLDVIQEGQKKAEETALAGNSVKQEDIKKSTSSASDMVGAIAIMAMTMLIGGYIIQKNPGIIKDSLKFAATLAVFLIALSIPMKIMTKVAKDADQKSLDAISAFIIKSAAVMVIGALFMKLNLFKDALEFTFAFTVFLLAMCAPLALMAVIGKSGAFKDADKIATLIVKCAFVMILGAIVMALDGGNFVKNALKFGVVLSLFLGLILLPFVIFSPLLKNAMNIANGMAKLIMVCAGVMIIGALFMLIDDLWKKALMFGVVLSAFILEITAAVLLTRLIMNEHAEKTLMRLTRFIITATIILLIGTWFMQSDKLWKDALKFGLVLMGFIALILLPFVIFGLVIKQAIHSLREVMIFILAATLLMMIGAVIVNEEDWIIKDAFIFAAMLSGFLFACIIPVSLYAMLAKNNLKNMLYLAAFIVICSAVLILGPYLMRELNITWGDVLGFTAKLAIFTAVMGAICIGITILAAPVSSSIPVLFEIALAIALFAGAFYLAHFAMSEITLAEFGELALYVTIIGVIFGLLGVAAGVIAAGGIAAALAGVGLMALCGALWVVSKMTDKLPTIEDLLQLSLKVAEVGVLFAALGLLSPLIAYGSIVAIAMSAALVLTCLAFWAVQALIDKAPSIDDLLTLSLKIGEMAIVFTVLGLLSPAIALGSVAAIAMSAALTLLSLSFMLLNTVIDKIPEEKVILHFTFKVGLLGLLFTALGLLSPAIVLGSAATIAMSAALTLLSLSLMLLNKVIPEMPAEDAMNNFIASVAIIGLLFTALGLLSPAIALGSGAAIAMSAALTLVSLSLMLLASVISEMPAEDALLDFIEKVSIVGLLFTALGVLSPAIAAGSIAAIAMSGALDLTCMAFVLLTDLINETPTKDEIQELCEKIGIVGLLFSALGALSPIIALGSLAALALSGAITSLSKALILLGTTVDIFSKIDTSKTSSIGDVMADFIDSVADGISVKRMLRLAKVQSFMPSIFRMAATVGLIGKVVAEMASLKVPTSWDKDGNPTGYMKLTDKDFENAGKNVERVITPIGDAIIGLYTKNPEMFQARKGKWWEAQKTPFEIVCASCYTLGELVANIAHGVEAFANMKVPIEWDKDGKPINFTKLKEKDLENASLMIGKVVSNVVEGIMNIITEHPDYVTMMTDACTMYEDGTKVETKSAFTVVLSASTAMGGMLSSIAAGIQDFANLSMPIYNSKGEITGRVKMSPTDFDNAKTNIGKILTTIFDAVSAVSKDQNLMNQLKDIEHVSVSKSNGVFGIGAKEEKTVTTETSPMMKLIDALSTIGGFVGGAAAYIGMYAKNQYMIGDTMVTVSPAELTTAKSNIVNVLCSMINAVADIANGTGTGTKTAHDFIFSGDAIKQLNTMGEVINKTTETLGGVTKKIIEMADSLKDFKVDDFIVKTLPDITKALLGDTSKEDKTGLFAVIDLILNSEFIKASAGNSSTLDDANDVLKQVSVMLGSFTDVVEAIKKVKKAVNAKELNIDSTEQLNNLIQTTTLVAQAAQAASTLFVDNTAEEFQDMIAKGNAFSDLIKVIAKIKNETLNNFNSDLSALLHCNEILSTMRDEISIVSNLFNPYDESSFWLMSYFDTHKEFDGDILLEQSIKLISVIEKIGEAVKLSLESFCVNKETFKGGLEILGLFKEEIRALNGMFDGQTISTGKLFWKKTYEVGGFKGDELIKNSTELYKVIDLLAKSANLAQSVKADGFRVLTEGVLSFINEINGSNLDLTAIKDVTEQADKYVKAVNDVNVEKLNTLSTFIDKLDNLSQHMGDLDKLVEALSGELTSTLSELANRIDGASKIIKESDRIQQQRHKLIDKSIDKIKETMSQSLKVEVKAVDDILNAKEN